MSLTLPQLEIAFKYLPIATIVLFGSTFADNNGIDAFQVRRIGHQRLVNLSTVRIGSIHGTSQMILDMASHSPFHRSIFFLHESSFWYRSVWHRFNSMRSAPRGWGAIGPWRISQFPTIRRLSIYRKRFALLSGSTKTA